MTKVNLSKIESALSHLVKCEYLLSQVQKSDLKYKYSVSNNTVNYDLNKLIQILNGQIKHDSLR